MSNKENCKFQTEVSELLNLIINSLYSNPEIFLRELISNASDALDKLKLESATNESLLPQGYTPEIFITTDPDKNTISISDNGIGMTLDEVKENIGTIAHSGTKKFMQIKDELKDNPSLIGQFGVGFYSAFIVADKVCLETKKAGTDKAVRWESDGKSEYTIEEIDKDSIGTTVTLYLKDKNNEENQDLADFTKEWKIKDIVKKHSDFIAYPIKMECEKFVPQSKEDEEAGKEPEKIKEIQVLNSMKALWLKKPSEITKEEYNEFYKQMTYDYSEPLLNIHFQAEGVSEFTALLFIPSLKPFNYDYENVESGLSLYVKRVLIMNDCKELITPYLRFIKGLVDSSDLSLNVSREILQQDRELKQINKSLVSKILKSLQDLMNKDRETYEKFWVNFGPTLKEGIVRDPERKEKIIGLSLFKSNNSQDKFISVDEYIANMKEGQPCIYYITAENISEAQNTPFMERLNKKGYDVLFMLDPVDPFIVNALGTYKDKKFECITSSDLDIDTEEEKKENETKIKEKTENFSDLLSNIKDELKDYVDDVKFSSRLSDSPVCLVKEGPDFKQMEYFYKQIGQAVPKQKACLECNLDHPIFDKMKSKDADTQKNWAWILYNQALISQGEKIDNPNEFCKKIIDLMN